MHLNRVVVFTDGASRDNQHRAIRRAGVGAFWAKGHSYNITEPLRGPCQTNNRAELTAIIRVLDTDSRPVKFELTANMFTRAVPAHCKLGKVMVGVLGLVTSAIATSGSGWPTFCL